MFEGSLEKLDKRLQQIETLVFKFKDQDFKEFIDIQDDVLLICWRLAYLGRVDAPYYLILKMSKSIPEENMSNWVKLKPHFI